MHLSLPLSLKSALATLALAALAPAAAHAQVTITIFQSGSDVDAQATGKLNLTGLTASGFGGVGDFAWGWYAGVLLGNSGPYDVYYGFTGPDAFGSGTEILASSGSGDRFAIVGIQNILVVPAGYTSNSAINGSAVFTGQTLSSLGLTPGTYSYKLPNDTVTVNIGAPAPAVPEPSTVASLGVGGLGLLGLALRARKRRTAP